MNLRHFLWVVGGSTDLGWPAEKNANGGFFHKYIVLDKTGARVIFELGDKQFPLIAKALLLSSDSGVGSVFSKGVVETREEKRHARSLVKP